MASVELREAVLELPHQEQFPLELLSRDRLADPWPWFASMRERQSVRYDEARDCWDVFRYEDVKRVLTDVDSFRRRSPGEDEEGWNEQMSKLFPYTNDRDEFDRLYGPLKPFLEDEAFLGEYESEIEAITRNALDRALRDGTEFDFVADVAEPIPLTVMGELLGVPREDRETLRRWVDGLIPEPPLSALEDGAAFSEEVSREMASMGFVTVEMLEYFDGLARERAEDPGDDVISHLVHDEQADLTHDEVVSTALLLVFAGNVTTINFIPVSLWTFHEQGILEEVRAGEVPLDLALEEVLRHKAVVKEVDKHATRDIELGGHEIAEGDQVFAWIGSANRDPARFDVPEEFRADRRPNPHLSFSTGMHFCKGAPLARLVVGVVLRTFLEEVEDVEFLTDDPDPRVRNTEYGFSSLPVSVTPSR